MLVEWMWVEAALCNVSTWATCQYQVALQTRLTGSGNAYKPQCGLWKWSSTKKNALITLKTETNHLHNIKKQCKSSPSSHNHEIRFLCEDLTDTTWNCSLIWIGTKHSTSICVHACRNMHVYAHMCDGVPCCTSLTVQQLLVKKQNFTPPPPNSILQTSFCRTPGSFPY